MILMGDKGVVIDWLHPRQGGRIDPNQCHRQSVYSAVANQGEALPVLEASEEAAQHPPVPAKNGQLSFSGTNIALGASCYQSSFYPPGSYHETNHIVDGIRTGGYSFHTDNEDRPWLMIRLSPKHDFDEVVIFNRLDHGSEKAQHLKVEMSMEAVHWQTIFDGLLANVPIGGIDGNPLRIIVPGSSAKYLRFSLPEFGCLHLDSVEVYKY